MYRPFLHNPMEYSFEIHCCQNRYTVEYNFEIHCFQIRYAVELRACWRLKFDPLPPSSHSNNRFFPHRRGDGSPWRYRRRVDRMTVQNDLTSICQVPSSIRVELIVMQQVGIFPRHRTVETRAIQRPLISTHFFKNTIFTLLPRE